MKISLILLVCLLGWIPARSQTTPALAITAEVVGVGTCEYDINGCYLKLTVKNVSSASRAFAIYSCSWEDSWTISKQGLQLGSDYGCESNHRIEIKLVPGQQINFYGFLKVLKLSKPEKLPNQAQVLASYSGIRFAFTESSFDSLFDSSSKHKPSITYWSNPVSLVAINNFYQVQPTPAK